MLATKSETKAKVAKAEVVKREPKQEAKHEAKHESKVKREGNTKLMEELAQRGRDLRAKKENAKTPKQEVKRERRQAKPKRKQRVTAKRRNSSREVMNRPVALQEELSEFLGETALSRPEVSRRIWQYAKDNNLRNPRNLKEVLCDQKLKNLLAVDSFTLFSLSRHTTPLLDYTVKPEATASPKRQRKSEPKREAKEEKKELFKDEKVKTKSSKSETKKEKAEASQRETGGARAEAAAKSLVLRLSGLLQRRLSVEFTTDALDIDQLQFAFVAAPRKPVSDEIRFNCNPGAREDADGNMESFGEGHLDGLSASTAYTVFVEIQAAGQKWRSMELTVPQRASPEKWTPHEVQLWATTLRVPEFTKKLTEYRVDGATLLTLGEADLRGLGLAVPFLLRRVSDALKVVSTWSV